MGGPGSGRWGGHQKALTVEQCWTVDVHKVMPLFHRFGGTLGYTLLPVPRGEPVMPSTWRPRRVGKYLAGQTKSILSSGLGAFLINLDNYGHPEEVDFFYRDPSGQTPGITCETVYLETTPQHFGNSRSWFLCPIQEGGNCNPRVTKLHLPPNQSRLGCRSCHGLTYESAQTHDKRVDAIVKNPGILEDLLELADKGLARITPSTFRLAVRAELVLLRQEREALGLPSQKYRL